MVIGSSTLRQIRRYVHGDKVGPANGQLGILLNPLPFGDSAWICNQSQDSLAVEHAT